MKFYNRTSELTELQRITNLSFNQYSRMTVITGRRRIGKTSLITKATEGMDTVYLFVSRKTETQLCQEFVEIINSSLNIHLLGNFYLFKDVFHYLLQLSESRSFNLIIDEFQEFCTINPSLFSDIQNLWDKYRKNTHLNLIISGSVYSLMHKIFFDKKEPLFGRADNILKIEPFDTDTLKLIMADTKSDYTNDELLALYTFTGGIPKYIEFFVDNNVLTVDGMINFMIRDNSLFVEEGKYLLVEEFGRNFGTYFSILQSIANGRNAQNDIQQDVGEKSVGGYLQRLMDDYHIISKYRPVGAKEGTMKVRYTIDDNFLLFWFKYINKNRSLIEIKNFKGLQEIVLADYTTFSGITLERYFRKKLAESMNFREIGSWWNAKDGKDEIDIVAIYLDHKKALIAEVKRQRKNFKYDEFIGKIGQLQSVFGNKIKLDPVCFTLDDM